MGEMTYLLTGKMSLGQWTIKLVLVSHAEVSMLSGAWTETSRDLSLLEVWRWQSLAGLVLGHMHNRFQGLWASGEVSAGVCHDLPCGKGRHEGLSESRWGREHTF